MKYIEESREGMYAVDAYLCKSKQIALMKAGEEYGNLVLQGKTETIDFRIWDLGSSGVGSFEVMDYAYVGAGVTVFQNVNRLDVKRIRKTDEKEYVPGDCLPVSSKDIEKIYEGLVGFIHPVGDPYLNKLAPSYFIEDRVFAEDFQFHNAAKSAHHGFVEGLLEHTLNVVKLYDYYAGYYPGVSRDLLLATATFHDIGKTKELSVFPENDYTDDGQLLRYTMVGMEIVGRRIRTIPGFPEKLATELKYCILAHHGELGYGSLKKPTLLEALTLNSTDNTDVKMGTMLGILHGAGDNQGWLGHSRLTETNMRKTMGFQRFG